LAREGKPEMSRPGPMGSRVLRADFIFMTFMQHSLCVQQTTEMFSHHLGFSKLISVQTTANIVVV